MAYCGMSAFSDVLCKTNMLFESLLYFNFSFLFILRMKITCPQSVCDHHVHAPMIQICYLAALPGTEEINGSNVNKWI